MEISKSFLLVRDYGQSAFQALFSPEAMVHSQELGASIWAYPEGRIAVGHCNLL